MPLALIGDPDPKRFQLVQGTIREAFRLDVKQATTFEELIGFYSSHTRNLALVLLTDKLPDSSDVPNVLFDTYLKRLRDGVIWTKTKATVTARFGYLLLDKVQPLFGWEADDCIEFPSTPDTKIAFLKWLEKRDLPLRLPHLTLDEDPLLTEQVRSLDSDRSLEKGKEVLRQLLRFFSSDQVRIIRLQSGQSGAKVFRVLVPGREYLIKISETEWKLAEEALCHGRVLPALPGYRKNVPNLIHPKLPQPETRQHPDIVSYGGWYAICFDFVGGNPFGPVKDLQWFLLASAQELMQISDGAVRKLESTSRHAVNAFRLEYLDLLLSWLQREWCMKKAGSGRSLAGNKMIRPLRQSAVPWITDDAAAKKYTRLPPYCLSGRTKAWILEFLESSDAQIGVRLIPNWEIYIGLIQQFVLCKGRYGTPQLDRRMSIIVSPAHGDLNANNILFCLSQQDPIFLIDFAMFQENGHALQDFAKLETEIKYRLMDRQQDSPIGRLPAFDITSTQFPLWQKLEDHLRGKQWSKPGKKWLSSGFPENVNLALVLVQKVRNAALKVHAQDIVTQSRSCFQREYLIPLLYHTLRSITFDTLSIFKRLLAVYSAAMLLKQAGFKG